MEVHFIKSGKIGLIIKFILSRNITAKLTEAVSQKSIVTGCKQTSLTFTIPWANPTDDKSMIYIFNYYFISENRL